MLHNINIGAYCTAGSTDDPNKQDCCYNPAQIVWYETDTSKGAKAEVALVLRIAKVKEPRWN